MKSGLMLLVLIGVLFLTSCAMPWGVPEKPEPGGTSWNEAPSPPQVVGTIDREQVVQILRTYFPGSYIRGVMDASYDLTNLSEIQRFLTADDTNKLAGQLRPHDLAFRLLGQFSVPGWNRIPVGWLGRQEDILNFALVSEAGLVVYGIDPATDRVWPLSTPTDGVVFAVMSR